MLADVFVRTLGARMAKGDVGLSRDACEALLTYHWPGNIRELQNAIERALIVSDGGLITAAQLGVQSITATPPVVNSRPVGSVQSAPVGTDSWADTERRMVEDALRRARGNKSRAAALLGLTRSQLYTRLQRYGIEA
jgi:DNA-binding NtrC family response regulator